MIKPTTIFKMMAIAASVVFLPFQSNAQTVDVDIQASIPDPDDETFVSFEWGTGRTVSKHGIVVKFELVVDDAGQPLAFRFDEASLKSLKQGDSIPLFIRNLKYRYYSGGPLNSWKASWEDESGADLWKGFYYPSLKGAWKTVTIESIRQTGNELQIGVKETLTLENGCTVRELSFFPGDGYLVDTPTSRISPKSPLEFVIKEKAFIDRSAPYSDNEIVIAADSVEGFKISGKVTFRTGADGKMYPVIWADGVKHTLIGKLQLKGYVFESDATDPLIFKVDKDKGYVYLKGRGNVRGPDGTEVKLPME